MKKINRRDVEGTSPEGTEGVAFKPLIAKELDPPNFYLRVFDVSPGGHTPKHSHDWEHEIYVVKGRGKIVMAGNEESLYEGDAVLVEPNELHQFVNSGDSLMRMVCVIPKPKND